MPEAEKYRRIERTPPLIIVYAVLGWKFYNSGDVPLIYITGGFSKDPGASARPGGGERKGSATQAGVGNLVAVMFERDQTVREEWPAEVLTFRRQP